MEIILRDLLTIFALLLLGFIGNGSHCAEPPRYDFGFLLLSQGVATIRVPFNGKRGKPVTMSSVSLLILKHCKFQKKLKIFSLHRWPSVWTRIAARDVCTGVTFRRSIS